jgi:hypothetical protein
MTNPFGPICLRLPRTLLGRPSEWICERTGRSGTFCRGHQRSMRTGTDHDDPVSRRKYVLSMPAGRIHCTSVKWKDNVRRTQLCHSRNSRNSIRWWRTVPTPGTNPRNPRLPDRDRDASLERTGGFGPNREMCRSTRLIRKERNVGLVIVRRNLRQRFN